MKLVNKRFFILILSFAILMLFNNLVFANESDSKEQVDSIKMTIGESFEKHKAALELDKNKFGLSASESFADATLGEGVPYYVISSDFLNNEQSPDTLSKYGYVFPIKVGKKSAGIVFVREIDGKYDVVGMQNNLTFEEDIANAKRIFNDNMPTELVYDKRLHLYALANKTKHSIVPLLDNEAYGVKKDKIMSLETAAKKVREKHNEMKQNPEKFGVMGYEGANSSQEKQSLYYIIIGLSLIALPATFFVVIRKRKHAA